MAIRFTPDESLVVEQEPKKPVRFVPDEGVMSRKDISNFGITEKTNTKQRQVITDALRRQADSLRPDGTKKGKGFLGEQKLPGGDVASEYSVGVQLKSRGGKETDIPTLVPTLTPEERTLMINDIIPNKKPVPDSIIQKAVDHANKRVGEGKDVFFQEGEDVAHTIGTEEIKAARSIAEQVKTDTLPEMQRMPQLFGQLPGGFMGQMRKPVPTETTKQQYVNQLRAIRKGPGTDQEKDLAAKAITRTEIDNLAGQIQRSVQSPVDAARFQEESEKLKDKFLKKTYRRWERGSAMVVGGGMHLVEELTRVATLGKYGETAADYAKMYHDVLKQPEMVPVVENAVDKYFGGAVETAPFLISAMAPAALTGGASLPSSISSFLVAYAVESNNTYQAARDRGLSDRAARIRSVPTGLINGGIEVFGGGSGKYFKNKQAAIKAVATKLGKAKVITRSVLKNALKEGLLEELPQGAVSMVVGGDVPKKPDGSVDYDAVSQQLTDDAIMGTILGGLIDAPLSTYSTFKAGKEVAKQKKVESRFRRELSGIGQQTDIAEEVPPISEAIERPTGLPAIEETPTEAIPATERLVGARTGQEGLITPEEELETPEEAVKAESKLETEAAEELEPELYIGNVTARMKSVMGEAVGKEAEDVKGFTEKGFPTKRTKIKMTRGEAEEYLEWLENDLNERLDQNRIKTRNQMAWANADWGDIKTLRETLGLEAAKRPFSIFYGDKNEIIDIKKTSERIKAAIQPSTLQESKMTVGEVLGAVMKRGARFAKMAYATGRTELRSQLRSKARAKKRMNKAVKTIKQKVPRTVDIVYRQAIDEIKATIDPSLRSKKTLKEREGLQEFLKRNPEKAKDIPIKLIEALGKKPLNSYTIEELEQIAGEIERLKDLGGLRRKLEVKQYEKGKQKDLEAIKAGSVPINDRTMFKTEKIGQKLSLKTRTKNKLSRMLNTAAQKWRSVATPMDVMFDMLDGTKNYLGANYRIFKKALDTRWSNYLDTRDEHSLDVIKLSISLGLKEGNFERIGVHAALQQEGGRQKLIDTGYTEEQIDDVKLNPEEMKLYELMREKLDDLTPEIEDVMHNVYNQPLQTVANYFSFMTDFESMTDYEIRDIYGDKTIEFSSALKKNVGQGFTITRKGGKQKIKINAMEIFLQHTDNASYLIEMGEEIKRLAEIAATEDYRKAVGDVGQEEVRSWLDLMARKGRTQRNKTIPILDIFRKHTGAAVIGFKLSSALVNATPLLDGAGLIGRYAFQGASDIATSRQWRAFLSKNFPEVRDRMGGDIELLDFGSSTLEKTEKMGFWALQKIDGLAASSIAAGSYQKYIDEHGLKLDFENPNPEAINYAQRIMRRSQSSAFFKDLPSAFTRGTLTGNKSLDRLLLQFQSFILNRWSLIEHDMIRSGIKNKNIGQAANMFFWLAMAGFAEMGLRRLSKELIALLTGEELDDWSETFSKEAVVNTLQNVPFISQGVSLYNYGNIPVPTLSLMQDIGEKIVTLRRTKDPDKRLLKSLELIVLSTGVAAGMPGTMQLAEFIRSSGKSKGTKGTRKEPSYIP